MKRKVIALLFLSVASLLGACGGGSEAQSCFDVSAYTPGSVITQQYEQPWSGQERVLFNLRHEPSAGVASFNNKSNVLAVQRSVGPAQTTTMSIGYYTQTSYFESISSKETIEHGSITTYNRGFARIDEQIVYSPPLADRRFSLKEGEAFSHTTTATITKKRPSEAAPTISEEKRNDTITFNGEEQIYIGSRSVIACKFSKNAGSEWFYRSMLVQTADPNGNILMRTIELNLNGQPY